MKKDGANKGGNFIVINRSLLNWGWHKQPSMMSIWIHILLKANWKDGIFEGKIIPRGSLVTSYRALADETGNTVNTVRKCIKRLSETGEIEVNSNTRFSIIKVVNYAVFQDIGSENHTPSDTRSDTPSDTQGDTQTHTRRAPNRTNNKGVNKGKQDKGKFFPPKLDELKSYADEIGYKTFNAEKFLSHYTATGWKAGKTKITDWREKVREWKAQDERISPNGRRTGHKAVMPAYMTEPLDDLREATPEECETLKKKLDEHKRKQGDQE